jgi:SAM-dependent MidA family methyltransferase
VSDGRLTSWFADAGVQLVDGQRAEVNLGMLAWLEDLGTQLERGHLIVFDYGARTDQLYSDERLSGTLRAFRDHHVSGDVLFGAGHQDITAHVDFDALERGARAAGFTPIELTRQAEFLLANGLDGIYEAARAEADVDWATAVDLRSAIRRLLDTQALGGYQVATFGKGL